MSKVVAAEIVANVEQLLTYAAEQVKTTPKPLEDVDSVAAETRRGRKSSKTQMTGTPDFDRTLTKSKLKVTFATHHTVTHSEPINK